ncbi:MAG: hypothetical protein HC877_18210 [Thioploca sp.]|nr:hypothetical protein [Thioploca sp.]
MFYNTSRHNPSSDGKISIIVLLNYHVDTNFNAVALGSGVYGLVLFFGRHQYIYSRVNLLAKFLNEYMLLTDKEWEQFKADKKKVKQVQWNIIPFLSWGLIPACF